MCSLENDALTGSNPIHLLKSYLSKGKAALELEWEFGGGDRVISLYSADVDGDGQTEVIIGSCDWNVYVVDRQGTEKWRFKTGGWVRGVYAADIDEDGDCEVLVASEDGSVYALRRGDLVWESKTGCIVCSVWAVDAGGDGKVEVVAGLDSGEVVVIESIGVTKRRFKVESTLYSLCAADVDGDGCLELIGGSEKGTVCIYDMHGNAKGELETRDRVHSVYAADIDDDGCVEIIAGSEDRSIYVWDRTGMQRWRYETENVVFAVYAADVDADGHVEVLAGSQDRHIYILDHKGALKWAHLLGDWVLSVHAADIDGDKATEIVAGLEDSRQSHVYVYRLGEIKGLRNRILQIYDEVRGQPSLAYELDVEDWDLLRVLGIDSHDQLDTSLRECRDAYEKGHWEKALSLFLRLREQGGLSNEWRYETGNGVRSVHIADIDQDGQPEILAGSEDRKVYILDTEGNLKQSLVTDDKVFSVYGVTEEKSAIRILAGTETGMVYAWDKAGTLLWQAPAGHRIRQLCIADINGDGRLEVAASSQDGNVYAISDQGQVMWRFKTQHMVRTVQIVDIDRDEELEIVATSQDKNVYVLSYEGKLKWKFTMNDAAFSVCIADINGDGEYEVVAGLEEDKSICAFDTKGHLLWRYQTSHWVRSVFVAHLGRTGKPMIIGGSEDCTLYMLDSEGNLKQRYKKRGWVYSVDVEDIDMDGHWEMVLGSQDRHVYMLKLIDEEELAASLEACWSSLGKSRESEADPIKELLNGPDEFLQGYAVQRLTSSGSLAQAWLELLDPMIEQRSIYTSRSLGAALPALWPRNPQRAMGYLRQLLFHSSPEVRLAVVNRLPDIATIDPDTVFQTLEKIAGDQDVWVRREVCRSIARLEADFPERVFSLAVRMAQDGNKWIQHETARILAVYFDDYSESNLIFRGLNELLDSGCSPDVLRHVSYLSHDAFVQRIFALFHGLLYPRLTEQIIAAQPLLADATRSHNFLSADVVETLQKLQRVVQIIYRLEQVDNLQAKMQYALQIITHLEETSRFISEHLDSSERTVFSHMLSSWRNVLGNTLKNLQQASDLRVVLASKRLPYATEIVVVFDLENRGVGLAENIRASIEESDAYTVVKGLENLPVLYPGKNHRLAFTIRPKSRKEMRVKVILEYEDLVSRHCQRTFGDRVRFFELAKEEFVRMEPNPYIIGLPVRTPEMFVGRQDVFDYIRDNLKGKHRDSIIVLHGQRRTGKTSILYQMGRILGDEYVPVFIDMQSILDAGTAAFLFTIARAVHNTLKSRDLEIPAPQFPDFVGRPGIVFREEFLTQVLRMIGDRTLILMFDEFELLDEFVQQGKLDQGIFNYLRNLMQHSDRLDFAFAGTHKLEEMSGDYWSILFNMALYRKVSFLDLEDARQLISRPVSKHFEYDELAIDKIIWATAGHPHFIQLLCHHLVTYRNRKELTYITVGDVNEVIDAVIETGGIHINYIWAQSSNDERLFMAALSETLRQHGRATISDLRAVLDKYAVRINFAEVIRNLIARDLLVEEGADSYAFRIGLVERWVERNKSIHQILREVQG